MSDDPTANKSSRTKSEVRSAQVIEAAREPVVSLRQWGTHNAMNVPPQDGAWLIGRAPVADLQINNETVSSRHAEIVRAGARLFFRDLGSRNGSFHKGAPLGEIDIEPNMVIDLGRGGVRLVAATPHGIDLRRMLQRFIGYAEPFQAAVDEAAQAAAHRRHVILIAPPGGQPDRVARLLHEAWLRVPRPFVVVDRVSGSRQKQRRVIADAASGTLVVPADGLPSDPRFVLDATAPDQNDVRLVLVAERETVPAGLLEASSAAPMSVVRIPRLVDRREDLGFLIATIQAELAGRLGAEHVSIEPQMPALLAHTWPANLDELETVLTYVLAVGKYGSQRAACAALNVKRSTLNDRLRDAGLAGRGDS